MFRTPKTNKTDRSNSKLLHLLLFIHICFSCFACFYSTCSSSFHLLTPVSNISTAPQIHGRSEQQRAIRQLGRTEESWNKTECGGHWTGPHSAVRKDRPEKVLVCNDMIEGWNKLPVNVRSATSSESFRKKLKRHEG
jgi:hypothetical protein